MGSKKLAVMQPYLFPYLGYWQLLDSVDRFVIYDDVDYIPRGWINRNRILLNGEPGYITVPLSGASQNRKICDLLLVSSPSWRTKMIKTIRYNYSRAKYFDEIFPLIVEMVNFETDVLSKYLVNQISVLMSLLDIDTELVVSSRCYENSALSGQNRILDICAREGATTYINAQGGRDLYDVKDFQNAGVNLCFLVPKAYSYKQRSKEFVPDLSIIDIMMELGVNATGLLLNEYDIAQAT